MAYGRPGVYVNERLLPAPLAATGTSAAAGACIGTFAQGPTGAVGSANAVTLVTSWYDFTQKFGGYDAANPATFGVGMFFQNGGSELYVRRVLGSYTGVATAALKNGTDVVATFTTVNPGVDGNNLRVQAVPVSGRSGYYNVYITKESGIADTIVSSAVTAGATDDILVEQFLNIVFNDTASQDYVESVINNVSAYVTVAVTSANKALVPAASIVPFTGGTDGSAAVAADYTAALADFNIVDRPLVIFAPEVLRALGSTNGLTVQNAIINWADANDGFAVVDTPADLPVTLTGTGNDVMEYAASLNTSANAAVYYPNLYIVDPLGRNTSSVRKVAPAGAVAGLYLATDKQFGPFKAPAGLRVAVGGAMATEKKFTSDELDTLNSSLKPVNAIRDIPGSGVVVMGARTLKNDGTANRYVSMRRSLTYIKKELQSITQFALFETNDDDLWARIRTSVGIFLNNYRNQGGLAGNGPDSSYYVKCDRENNSATSVANGEVHIEVGVALEYPAEFVVITLSQKTAV